MHRYIHIIYTYCDIEIETATRDLKGSLFARDFSWTFRIPFSRDSEIRRFGRRATTKEFVNVLYILVVWLINQPICG